MIRIIGHNIQYDLSWIFGNPEIFFCPEYIEEKNKKRYWKNILTRNGKFYQAKYHNLRFEDTLNLFPLSLSKAGEVLGYEKLQTPDKFTSDNYVGYIERDDINYCVRDCEVTFLIWKRIKEFTEMNGGKLKLTLASCSRSIIDNTIPEIGERVKKLNIDYKFQTMDECFRDSYYGGRAEVFRTEIENANYYDINSLYPYVLSDEDFDYPDPLTYRQYHGDIKNIIYDYEGTARIKFQVPYMKIPLLPIRHQKLNKLIYGYGVIEGNYNFPEIRKALEKGYEIIEYSDVIIADKMKSPLKSYIEELYNQRLKAQRDNNPEEKIIKLFLNSGYGKFAQRNGGSKYVPLSDEEEKSGPVVMIDGIPYIRISSDPTRAYCDIVSIASYTTSYARLTLYDYLDKCDNVVYCDTDSIITTSILPTGKKLGEMKLEGKIKYGSFKGRKDYYVEMEDGEKLLKRKGVSTQKILSINGKKIVGDVGDYLKDIHEADILEFSKITKSRESIIRGIKPGMYKIQRKERHERFDTGRYWETEISDPFEMIENITVMEYEDQMLKIEHKYHEKDIDDYVSDHWRKKKLIDKYFQGDESLYDETLENKEHLPGKYGVNRQ